jgi:hypothetical protein
MTVLFVFGDMLEDEVSLVERAAVPVAFDEEAVSVDDSREVMMLPETAVVTVTTPTLVVGLVEVVGVGVSVGVSELEMISLVLGELLCVGVTLGDVDGVDVGVLDGVLLADVVLTATDPVEEDASVAVVPVPKIPVAAELVSEGVAFFSTSRRMKRFESNQLA